MACCICAIIKWALLHHNIDLAAHKFTSNTRLHTSLLDDTISFCIYVSILSSECTSDFFFMSVVELELSKSLSSSLFLHIRGAYAMGVGNLDSFRTPFEPQHSAHIVIAQHDDVLTVHSTALNAPMPFTPESVAYTPAVTARVIPAAMGTIAKIAIPRIRQKRTNVSLGSPTQNMHPSAEMMYPMYRKALTLCIIAIPISIS